MSPFQLTDYHNANIKMTVVCRDKQPFTYHPEIKSSSEMMATGHKAETLYFSNSMYRLVTANMSLTCLPSHVLRL
jgi:hypothetical protein